ncbi:MAG: extracellular solute-binding protein [Clostridia bacterium]|nr:extracellular solute-binding protein [Clostridia bacterium]
MKRALSLLLTLALLLPCFAACESGGAPSASGQPAQTADGEGAAEADLYPDFEMPEATDSLTVYSCGFSTTMLTKAVEIFRATYPDVTVDVQTYGEDEYRALLRTEIPAGRGPDFVFGSANDFQDVYKTMKTGIFEDLNPYLVKDEEFDFSEYNQAVLDGGLLYGHRYILPLRYTLSLYITSEENLRDNGIDTAEFTTFDGCLNACMRYGEQNPDNHLLQNGALLGGSVYLRELFLSFAYQMIDYEAEQVVLDKEAFRRGMELCRMWYDKPAKSDPDAVDMSSGAVLFRRCLFLDGMTKDLEYISAAYVLSMNGETPVLAAIPDERDGVTAQIEFFGAIPTASRNKLNAYRLMKILLSREIQLGDENAADVYSIAPTGFFGMPVHNPSLKKRLELIRDLLPLYNPTGLESMPPVRQEDIDALYTLTERITRAVMLPPILLTYMKNCMESHLKSKADFDKCYNKLLNTLEIYKDE